MLKSIYVKWYLKHCPHICMFCKYKNEMKCIDEFNSYTWKELIKMKKNGGRYGT